MKDPNHQQADVADAPHPNPPPSWFAQQGVSCCSKWGKTEIEYLAWAYVASQARSFDIWREVTPEQCYDLLTEEERRIIGCFKRDGTMWPAYHEWWEAIGRQLRDADGAFEVGGLAWSRWRYEQSNDQAEPAASAD